LEAGVRVLETERSLVQTFTPSELAAAFGISSRLALPWGGHVKHALLVCALYAALYAVALVVEIAYQFDRYRRAGVPLAVAIFLWIFLTALAGLAVDWRRTLAGRHDGFKYATGIFLLAAAVAFLSACFFLPGHSITELNWQAYTAQAAYLKTLGYFIILALLFLLPPFHFVLAMQRELSAGRQQLACGLLSGAPLSATPKGAIFLRFWVLAGLLVLVIAISLFLHHNLMSNLKPSPYQNLFSNFILLRLLLYYALGAECLLWYGWALNEFKRECLAAQRQWSG
jgi:hypothetical protein